MPTNRGFTSRLLRLAAEPARASGMRLWRALDTDARESAVLAAVEKYFPDCRGTLVEAVRKRLSRRFETVAKWPLKQLAREASKLTTLSFELVNDLLVALHLEHRRELLCRFLTALSIPHDDCVIRGEVRELTKELDPASVCETLDQLANEYSPDHVLTYALALYIQDRAAWAALECWFESLEPAPAIEEVEEVPSEEPQTALQKDAAATGADDFTTLDIQLIRVIVDSAQGVAGSLLLDELDDLLDELVQLNGTRHRSYFHLGFRDAVVHRPVVQELNAENVERRRWYLAGYVHGIARRRAWEVIGQLFSENEDARSFSKTLDGPARAAVPLVFEALCETGRHNEAAKFLTVDATVARADRILPVLEREATRLLRQGDPQSAKGLLLRAQEALVSIDAHGLAILPAERRHNLMRRLAHCHRELGELTAATDILDSLLEDVDLGATHRSRVLVDLALMDCGFRRLADLRLPRDSHDQRSLREALEKAASTFEEALHIPGADPGHARFVVGMLKLYKEEWKSAVSHLDEAVASFEADPEAYEPGGLRRTACMALAVAICLHLDYARLERAAELLVEGCAEGASIPPHLVEPMLAALEMGGGDLARRVGEAVLDASDAETLRSLVRVQALHQSSVVADAVVGLGRDALHPESTRMQDLRSAMPFLLAQGRLADAADVLELLEDAAVRGTGTGEFLDLLDQPALVEPAWEVDEVLWARVRVHEVLGRYGDAAQLLEAEFRRVLAAQRFGFLDEAEGLLNRIRGYGMAPEHSAHLEARLTALRAQEQDTEVTTVERGLPARVLVVGGNEVQARHDYRVIEVLATTHPHLELEFMHSGWTANWDTYLADVMRRLPHIQGLVLMRFMRTTLGRRIRAASCLPWRSCGGSGVGAVVGSAIALDAVIQQQLRAKVGGAES